MNLWQQLFGAAGAATAAEHLREIAGRPAARPDDLAAAIETADRLRARNPDHFGLCFGLGRAGERAAAAVVWDRRTPWIERALDYYEDSVRLALAGKIAGSDRVPEAMASAWEPGPTLQQRALLAASFQAGLLRSAEFRARDPRAGIAHLTRVVTLLRGYHPAWYFLGEAYLLDHQFDAAERAWTEALRRSPDSPILTSVLRNLPADRVHHLVKQGDWHAVLLAIECLPEDALPVSERFTIEGDARLAAGDSVGARRCWLAALAADRLAVGVRHRLRQLDHRGVGDHVL